MHEHAHEHHVNYLHKHETKKHQPHLITFFICGWILTLIVALWWNTHEKKEKILNEFHTQYPLVDPARAFIASQDLILNIQELRSYLQNMAKESATWADISIYFEVLNTGANVAVNPETEIFPASLTKLPLAMTVMKRMEAGKMSLDDTLELTADDADELGTPGISKEVGQRYTVKFLLEQLLGESDNSAYRMLKRQVSDEELRGIGQAVGLDSLFNPEGKLTAKDYTRLLRALFTAGFLDTTHSQLLLELLQKSSFNGLLRAGIPHEIPFAHKWGTNIGFGVYADSGIVYVPNRPYMISVMLKCKNDDQDVCKNNSSNIMKSIGEKTYQYITGYVSQ